MNVTDLTDKWTAFRARTSELALTLLRVTIGVIMIAHGWDKLQGIDAWTANLAGMGIPFPEISVWLAIAGELLGGIGLAIGLFTPIAALGVFFSMSVAIVSAHLDNGLMARDGGFEYPLTLMMGALFFFARGGGRYSVDAIIDEPERGDGVEAPSAPPAVGARA